MRVWPGLRIALVLLIAGVLLYRAFAVPDVPYSSVSPSSTGPSVGAWLKRLITWERQPEHTSRSIRVVVHIFEARSTGVLPLSLPPLEPVAVSRPGDRLIDIIRETAQYYDRLNALYPDAHFELLTAEEGMMVVKETWSGDTATSGQDGLTFRAHDYTIHVVPLILDASNWLRIQITVEHKGRFLLGNTITRATDGTPMVVGGPVGEASAEGSQRAVFVGVTVSFIPTAMVKDALEKNSLFQTYPFDIPPRLIELAEVAAPEQVAGDEEVEGMSIFLTHIDARGRMLEATLVSSLRPAYDEVALGAIKRSRFTPAMRAGQPVDAWMVVPVQFVSPRHAPGVSASRAKP